MAITGGGLREVFETILPEDALMAAVRSAGLQERERKLDALALLRSMVISASTGYGGRQADAMKLYFQSGTKKVVRGAFYSWFGRPLEQVLEVVRVGRSATPPRSRSISLACSAPRCATGTSSTRRRSGSTMP